MLPKRDPFLPLYARPRNTLTLRFSRFRILCSMVTSSCLSGLYGSGVAFNLAAFPLLAVFVLLLAKSVWLPSVAAAAAAAALLLLLAVVVVFWPLVASAPPAIPDPPREVIEERFSLLAALLLLLLLLLAVATQLLVERAFRCKNLQEPSCSSKVFKSLCSPQKAG